MIVLVYPAEREPLPGVSLLNLPLDILREVILSGLHKCMLLICRMVCKRLRSIIPRVDYGLLVWRLLSLGI
jgi:hypothetical protein